MKLLSVLALGFAASTVTARATQAPLAEDVLDVPGDNPLKYCALPDDNILEIESVDLSPNPPSAGSTLTITASGNFKEDVEAGAKIHLQVKYGVITIVRQTADLCDTVDKVDLECPLNKGKMKLTKEVNLPKEIPPGRYTVLADVVTKDEEKITCLTATVSFNRGGAAIWDILG